MYFKHQNAPASNSTVTYRGVWLVQGVHRYTLVVIYNNDYQVYEPWLVAGCEQLEDNVVFLCAPHPPKGNFLIPDGDGAGVRVRFHEHETLVLVVNPPCHRSGNHPDKNDGDDKVFHDVLL